MPSSSASRAVIRGLRNQISLAFFLPTRSSRYQVPKPASKLPIIGPTWRKTALSLAIVMSHMTCKHVAAADRVAVDRGDDRLLQPLDALVHVEGRQHAGIKRRVLHAGLAPADAEEAVAGAGDDQDAGAGLAADRVDAVAHLVAHRLGEHVAVIGTVQRQGPDRSVLAVQDRLVTHRRCSFCAAGAG